MTIQKHELFNKILDRYQSEYDELLDNWRDLERKAQGAIAVSGILFAGIFGITTKSFDIIREYQIFFIVLTLLFLVGSIISAVRVLETKRVLIPPKGEDFQKHSIEMLEANKSKNDEEERLVGLLGDQCNTWKNANNDIRLKNEIKAKYLVTALSFSVYSLYSILFLTIIILIQKYGG